MQFRATLVLGSIVMVLSACGGEDDRGSAAPGHHLDAGAYVVMDAGGLTPCTADQVPASCPGFDASSCSERECWTYASECRERDVIAMSSCLAPWGHAVRLTCHDCLVECERDRRECLRAAVDYASALECQSSACVDACYDLGSACNIAS